MNLGSPADTVRKSPERLWTAARTMEVVRRLVHHTIAVSTAVLGQSHKDNAVEEQPEAKEVQLSQPSSTTCS